MRSRARSGLKGDARAAFAPDAGGRVPFGDGVRYLAADDLRAGATTGPRRSVT